MSHLTSLGVPPGRRLDVGCGAGHLLAQAGLVGWEPHGVDLSVRHVATAREGYGLNHIHLGTVADLDYPPEHFDAIALTAVIEHLRDPVGTLETIGGLLAHDGRLIVQTDNALSASYLLMRGRWPFFIPAVTAAPAFAALRATGHGELVAATAWRG